MNADRIALMGERLMGEATAKAQRHAEAVFGPRPAGTQDMGRKAFMAYVQRNWPDPSFREGLLTRIGPKQFRAVVIAMHGGDETVWPMPGSPLAKEQAMKPLPPMSDYQVQSLQDTQAKLALQAAQGGTNGT